MLRFTGGWRQDVYDDERAVSPVSGGWFDEDDGVEDVLEDDSEDHGGADDRDGCFWAIVVILWCAGVLSLSVLCFLGLLEVLMWIFGR